MCLGNPVWRLAAITVGLASDDNYELFFFFKGMAINPDITLCG